MKDNLCSHVLRVIEVFEILECEKIYYLAQVKGSEQRECLQGYWKLLHHWYLIDKCISSDDYQMTASACQGLADARGWKLPDA
jgi:hypothetical protein